MKLLKIKKKLYWKKINIYKKINKKIIENVIPKFFSELIFTYLLFDMIHNLHFRIQIYKK